VKKDGSGGMDYDDGFHTDASARRSEGGIVRSMAWRGFTQILAWLGIPTIEPDNPAPQGKQRILKVSSRRLEILIIEQRTSQLLTNNTNCY